MKDDYGSYLVWVLVLRAYQTKSGSTMGRKRCCSLQAQSICEFQASDFGSDPDWIVLLGLNLHHMPS